MANRKSTNPKLRVEYIADADETPFLVLPTAFRLEDLDVYGIEHLPCEPRTTDWIDGEITRVQRKQREFHAHELKYANWHDGLYGDSLANALDTASAIGRRLGLLEGRALAKVELMVELRQMHHDHAIAVEHKQEKRRTPKKAKKATTKKKTAKKARKAS